MFTTTLLISLIFSNIVYSIPVESKTEIKNDLHCSSDHACPNNLCCSQYGWCGSSPDYCGVGCQTFGNCNPSLVKVVPPPVNSCNDKQSCSNGMCCSQYGWCGTSTDYCGVGCQTGFGKCNIQVSAPPPVISNTHDCGGQTKCKNNMCCSQYGYCGISIDYCGIGCQTGFGKCNEELVRTPSSTTSSTVSSTTPLTTISSTTPSTTVSSTTPSTTVFSTTPSTTVFSTTTSKVLLPTNSNKLDLKTANQFSIACGGAVAIAANAILVGSVVTTGAFSSGDSSSITGDVDSVGAILLAANSIFEGTANTQAALTIGAKGTLKGNVFANAAVSLGATSHIEGNVITNAAFTQGAGSTLSGTSGKGTVHSSLNTIVLGDINNAYNNLASLKFIDLQTSINENVLLPGTYKNVGAFPFTDTLTLKGGENDVWVIQIVGAMAFSGELKLDGNISKSNIQWVVSGAVSILGTQFYGTVLSLAAISLGANSNMKGSLLSVNGACSMGDTSALN